MADINLQHDVADLGSLRLMTAFASLTAGGSGNNVQVVGATFDRESFANGSLPLSAEFAVLYSSALAATKTLTVAFDVQTSPDGATWADFATQAATLAATGPAGGGTLTGQISLGVDLTMAQRYIRFNFTPDLTNTSTDTATTVGAAFFAGFDRLPASP
jgi:hypothetical protein